MWRIGKKWEKIKANGLEEIVLIKVIEMVSRQFPLLW